MGLSVLRLICQVLLIGFYITADKDYQKTRQAKLIKLTGWSIIAFLSLLYLIFEVNAIKYLTIINIVIEVHLAYTYAKQVWPNE